MSFAVREAAHRWAPFFFFNDTATTEIYTLSLHDALPISRCRERKTSPRRMRSAQKPRRAERIRSEEHTSELQSHSDLVCRLLLEKKNERILSTGVESLCERGGHQPHLVTGAGKRHRRRTP